MARLLSKAETDLASLVDNSRSPIMGCVRVTQKFSEVTNGHYLVRVPACPMDSKDFPIVPGMGNGDGSDMLIPGKALTEAARAVPKRSRIPILNSLHAGAGKEPGETVLTSTDLESPSVKTVKTPDGRFPATEKIMADYGNVPANAVQVALSPAYLKALCAFAAKNGRGAIQLTLTPDESPDGQPAPVNKAIRLAWKDADGTESIALLMPMRY